MRTAEDIMKDSITDGLGLPRTGIQNDVIQEAVSKYNFCGRTIWDAWPWDSKKIDQFDTASASVSNFDTATAYSSVTPSATPTDYRVILFPLDKADQALQAYISDQLRLWDGQPQRNDWDALLRVAIGTQENQEQRTHQLIVPSPAFADVGRFEYGGNWGTAKTY